VINHRPNADSHGNIYHMPFISWNRRCYMDRYIVLFVFIYDVNESKAHLVMSRVSRIHVIMVFYHHDTLCNHNKGNPWVRNLSRTNKLGMHYNMIIHGSCYNALSNRVTVI
jgi:hypothetical protein